MSTHEDRDYDFEPLPGLPAPLPDGERLLWRGSPTAWRLSTGAFRLPIIGAYFALLGGWQLAGSLHAGASLGEIAGRLSWTAGLAAFTVGILCACGYLIARNTVYTITSRRVIFRHGVAMPMAINVPFAQIDGAEARLYADGSADLPLVLAGGSRVPRLLLWPHVRPWRYRAAAPMLRAVPDGERVARILGEALAQASNQPVAVGAASTAPARPAARPASASPDAYGRSPAGATRLGAA